MPKITKIQLTPQTLKLPANQLKQARLDQLTLLATRLLDSAAGGLLSVRSTASSAGTAIPITKIIQIPGPRTGILELYAGYHNGTLLEGLEAKQMALLRQLLWDNFQGEPQVYLHGKAVQVEAGWPDELTTAEIRLNELHQLPPFPGRFTLGQNIMGQTVALSLDSEKAHGIVAGTTGSGKSVTLQTITYQLALNGDRLILIDGKMGDGLRDLDRLPAVLGPMATTSEAAQRALAFGAVQMVQRYLHPETDRSKIIIVFDEIQEFRNDPIVVELIRKITSQGRGAGVHMFLATQHPTNEVMGDPTIKRNTTLRIGLKVTDASSSIAVMGGPNPRLDYLLGSGDGWSQTNHSLHHVQVAMIEPKVLKAQLTHTPELNDWPDLSDSLRTVPDLLNLDELTKPTNTKAIQFTGKQIAMAVLCHARDQSRAELIRQLEEAQLPISRKVSSRLWAIGRDVLHQIAADGQPFIIDGETITGEVPDESEE